MSSFTLLVDRGAAVEVVLAAWCPTMDLLALASSDGQLHVHRLNWQRLWWTSSPEAQITALAWRPDGKQLAAGLGDGSLLVLNTEDGEVLRRESLLPDAIVSLSWTEVEAAAAAAAGGTAVAGLRIGHIEDRARRLFAPPPAPVPAAGAALPLGYASLSQRSSQHWAAEPARLALLAAATRSGEVLLCTSGLFRLARLSLPQLVGRPQLQCCQLAAASDLSSLAVCWQTTAQQGKARSYLTILSTQHIGSSADQLHRLGLLAAEASSALAGCLQTWEAVCREWEGAMKEWGDSSAALRSDLAKFASQVEPQEQLLQLLATGSLSPGMLQYLSQTLGEAGLKKLARSLDSAVRAVHGLLTDRFQPTLEQLAFRLGDLRGLALCRPWAQGLGLAAAEVGTAEQAALALALHAERLRRQLVSVGVQYRAYCVWLLTLLRRLQEDNHDSLVGYPRSQAEAVAEFVRGQYERDGIGPQLWGDDDSEVAAGMEDSSGEGQGDATQAACTGQRARAHGSSFGGCTGRSDLGLVHEVLGRLRRTALSKQHAGGSSGGCGSATHSSRSSSTACAGIGIRQQLRQLEAAVAAAFGRTSQANSPTIRAESSLELGRATSQDDAPAGAAGAGPALTYLPGCGPAVCLPSGEQVLVLRNASSSDGSGRWEGALLQLPQGMRAVDAAWYKEGQLALLMAGAGSSSLGMLQPDELKFTPLPVELLARGGSALEACHELLSAAGVVTQLPGGMRQRQLPHNSVRRPLAVSASRGVGCVLAAPQRVLLLDLEEDEDAENEALEEEMEA